MRGLVLVACVILAPVAVVWRAPGTAGACVPSPLSYLVDTLESIVAGQITSWELAPDITGFYPTSRPIRLHLAVAQTFKGTQRPVTTIIDPYSLSEHDGSLRWGLSTTDCPVPFRQDPTGKWAVILIIGEGGEFVQVFLGDALAGMEYDDTIALIVAALPAGGGQPASSSFPTFPAAAAAIVGPVVFLAGAAFVWPRRG